MIVIKNISFVKRLKVQEFADLMSRYADIIRRYGMGEQASKIQSGSREILSSLEADRTIGTATDFATATNVLLYDVKALHLLLKARQKESKEYQSAYDDVRLWLETSIKRSQIPTAAQQLVSKLQYKGFVLAISACIEEIKRDIDVCREIIQSNQIRRSEIRSIVKCRTIRDEIEQSLRNTLLKVEYNHIEGNVQMDPIIEPINQLFAQAREIVMASDEARRSKQEISADAENDIWDENSDV